MPIDKNTKIFLLAIILVLLVSVSASYFLFKDKKMETGNNNPRTEIYLYTPNTTTHAIIAMLPDSSSFNFTPSSAVVKGSINDTINMSFAMVNHEERSMNYTLVVYQTDNVTGVPNFANIYSGATQMIEDNTTLISWVEFKPIYACNNSQIGIALMDTQPNGTEIMLNYSEVKADIVK